MTCEVLKERGCDSHLIDTGKVRKSVQLLIVHIWTSNWSTLILKPVWPIGFMNLFRKKKEAERAVHNSYLS